GGTAHPLLLLAADDATAGTLWRQDTSAGPVIERGPSLVRTATVNGDTLALTGDNKAPSDLEAWAPSGAKKITWNGAPVTGAQLPGPRSVSLPTLTNWKYHTEAPEASPSFDDSSWRAADVTTTNSNTKLTAGQPDLYADDYGFHYG